MTNMCTCVILLLLRLAANMLMNITLIIAEKRLNLTNLRIEMYPAEGPMLKAPVAPDPLMVSCSKSRTIVIAERCTHCRPSNDHREVDGRSKEETRKEMKVFWWRQRQRAVAETTPQKPYRPHTPEQVSRYERRFQRHALPKLRACRGWDGEYSSTTRPEDGLVWRGSASAAARACGTPLASFNFSIGAQVCSLFKLSQQSVKILYEIKTILYHNI